MRLPTQVPAARPPTPAVSAPPSARTQATELLVRAPHHGVQLHCRAVVRDCRAVPVGQLVDAAQQVKPCRTIGHLQGTQQVNWLVALAHKWPLAHSMRCCSAGPLRLCRSARGAALPAPCAQCPHPCCVVVGHERCLRVCQLAQLHACQRKQVAALRPRQACRVQRNRWV